ncbi:Helix-turn-helix domain-containing protein [Amycolatopsis arida]|uniref:Helix-turn-helix domain-containing protein n=1 Tax=Amycolatopsis arida TaxID=587909 RepID=A0A1I5SXC6_9PSEU|nr:helix-turn-helix transcriptional regulator [Amycolatopsis arida]TDX96312.1 helix-turn-helix protein [Amycolatopsis arida]SFP75389.1 Helix-turn-helix domain-containing protein [Amycolatopsis arida]
MPQIESTSVRSRQVSTILRQLREKSGKTAAEVARALGMSASKLSRIETGHRGLRISDVAALLGYYKVSEARREEILDIVRKADEQGWWLSQGTGLPEVWKELVDFESRATRIQNYELAFIPGLLQTDEYTAAVVQGINQAITDAELSKLVASRMARQSVLRRRNLQFLAVIDESALHRAIGEEGVMRRQLRHLIDMAERPNITIRVVPLSAGAHAGLRGPFAILDFEEEPSIAYVENHGTCLFLEEKDDLAGYRVALNNILKEALSPAKSVELITGLAGRT